MRGVEGQTAPLMWEHDEFGRMIRSNRDGIVTTYTYDGLDRRDTKIEGGRTFDLSYVGASEALSQEQEFGGQGEFRSYDYTGGGLERLGTARKTSATPTAPYRAYSTDAAGSVEGLEDDQGNLLGAPYSYDPYGTQLNSESALAADARENPFRFEGHYYDSAAKSYDMRARAYLPEIARFLGEDRYEDPQGDQALEADALTQDRYAFAGGNPVDNIEFDGHYAPTGDQSSRRIQTYGGDVQDRQTGRTVSGPNQSSSTSDRSGYSDNRSPTDSSKPELARMIRQSPVAPKVVASVSTAELERRDVSSLMALYHGEGGGYEGIDGILDYERKWRVARSEGGGLSLMDTLELGSMVVGPCKFAAAVCNRVAVAAVRAGAGVGKRAAVSVARRLGIGATKVGDDLPAAVGRGPHAGESIPARGTGRDFTAAEREAIDDIGSRTGCHTCGARTPGTKTGHFVPDHQPPSSLLGGGAQRLFPHCLFCSREQGLAIGRMGRQERGRP